MGDSAVDPPAVNVKSKRSASESSSGKSTNKKKAAGEAANGFANNIFSALPDDDAGNPLAKKRKTKPSISTQEPARKERCPPLFVKGDSPILRPSIRDCISNGYFKGSFRLCTDGVKLMLNDKQSYRNAVAFLQKRGWEFYTHDMPGTKPIKVLLRGLDDMDVEELSTELKECGLKPIGVHKITRQSNSRKYRDQLYLVHLEHGSTSMQELKKVEVINSTVIEWQKYKPVHRDVTQCQNCFRYGHGTRNCAMLARCNKCGDQHLTEVCDKMEESEPKCVNCGDKHRATTKACPKRAEFLEIRKRASSKNQTKVRTTPPPALNDRNFPPFQPRRPIPVLPPLQPQQRLVAAAGSVPVNPPNSQAPPTNQWQRPPPGCHQQDNAPLPPEDAAPLYTPEQLAPIFSELVARLRSCKSRFDQIYTLGLFVIENGY